MLRIEERVMTTLARNLVLARLAQGYSQQKLADESEISRATITQLERGDGDPRLTTLVSLAKALDVSPMFLFLGKEEMEAIIEVATEGPSGPILQMTKEMDQGVLEQISQARLRKKRQEAIDQATSAAQEVSLKSAGHLSVRGARSGAVIGTEIAAGIGTAIGAVLAGSCASLWASRMTGLEREKPGEGKASTEVSLVERLAQLGAAGLVLLVAVSGKDGIREAAGVVPLLATISEPISLLGGVATYALLTEIAEGVGESDTRVDDLAEEVLEKLKAEGERPAAIKKTVQSMLLPDPLKERVLLHLPKS